MPAPPLWAGYARAIVGGLSDPKIYQKSRDNLMQNSQEVQLAVDVLRDALPASAAGEAPLLGLVLGTGLSGLAAELLTGSSNGPAAGGASCVRVPFADLPGFPLPGVDSHQGAFVRGRLNGVPVLAQQGRCHLYEGRSPAEVCMGVRVMAGLGVKTLIITNAAGALNPRFEAGTLMCMADQINHTGASPLTGPNCAAWGERFPDMSAPFDPALQALALETAGALGIRLERGVYIGVHGPEMESPAETRMYRQWGADAVGMSTVLEVIAARHLGMRVLGVSCLSNKNLPDCMAPVPLAEVIAVAGRAGENLARLLRALVTKL